MKTTAVAAACILLSTTAFAGEKHKPTLYSKTVPTSSGRLLFQTAVKTMIPDDNIGPNIILVGLSQLGEESYYRNIEKIIRDSELSLLERLWSFKMTASFQALKFELDLVTPQLFLNCEKLRCLYVGDEDPGIEENGQTMSQVRSQVSREGRKGYAVLLMSSEERASSKQLAKVQQLFIALPELLANPNECIGDIAIVFEHNLMTRVEKLLKQGLDYRLVSERWLTAF